MKKRVLFLCKENSCRSQIAEGFLDSLASDSFEVYSAGSQATSVNAYAIEVMRESGIDISNKRSKSIEEFYGKDFDYIITVCEESSLNCPVFFSKSARKLHWYFEDPAKKAGFSKERLNFFRKIRDEIKTKIEEFISVDLDEDQ
ncbi:MAG: arsenate reductase ArsC [Candidatus Coatesbacteria bacterium]|nr:arsenate reductase ArsC [Candidatus Coatesbacteria bacterium]